MKARYIIACLILLLQARSVGAQQPEIRFDGNFADVPFSEFVETVEAKTGVKFYYKELWVRGIRVTASGTDMALSAILDQVLQPAGVGWFMNEYGQVYLSDQVSVVTQLPEYTRDRGDIEGAGEQPEGAGLTDTEQRYINGRGSKLPETIQVGQRGEAANGERAMVNGKIIDAETGEPIIGATIYVEELKKGAVTDVDGMFNLMLDRGRYLVDFNCMGMEPRMNYLEVLSDGSLTVTMNRSLISLSEVTIQTSRYHNVRGTQMGFNRLNYQVLKEVPVVMGEKDVLKVIQLLPGVQNVGEGSSGFNVRGSAADQNMVYVNKVPVYNINHLFGFFTAFNPDIIKDFTLYKSNLPASYGGRLASVFDLTTRQGNMNEFSGRGGISPVTGHIAVEGPLAREKSAFVLSARSTYSDWILKRLEDPDLRNSEAAFYDLAGSVTWNAGNKTLVKAFGYMSSDRFNLGTTNRYAYSNAGGSLNFKRSIKSRTTGDLALVYSQYGFSTVDMNIPAANYTHAYRIAHYEMKADLTWLLEGRHRITYGGNIIYYNLDRGTVEPYGEASLRTTVDLGTENGLEWGAYLADEITLLPALTLYGGIRFSGFLALGPGQVMLYEEGRPRTEEYVFNTLEFGPGKVSRTYLGPEPRVSLNYMTGGNSSVKFSYNRVNQYLFMLSNTTAISPTDQWKLCDYHITPPYVDQLSLGYYQDFPAIGVNTSLEVYHKWVSNVVEYRDGANFITSPYIETQTLQGEQKAYGLEAMVKKSTGKLNGWVSYSFSRSTLLFNSNVPGESINDGLPFPSNYDRPHNVSVVANLKINRRLSFSSNLVYITGRPVTYPISIYYFEGTEVIDYSDRNSYRIPDYFRIDMSLNLEGNLKKRKLIHSYWMLNLYNLTGRRNAYSVFFRRGEEGTISGYRLSIFGRPVVTLSWNFKFGNYASE